MGSQSPNNLQTKLSERDRNVTADKILAVAFFYFVAAKLSLMLAFDHTNATPVWPPTGIALAAVMLMGNRIWPGIFAGAFFANTFALSSMGFSVPASVLTACSTAAGNTLEALAGAALIHRFTGNRYPFDSIRDAFIFVALGALLSAMISATVGVTSLCLKTADWTRYERLWLTWWLGDAAGAIIVTPVFLSWSRRKTAVCERSKTIEALLLFVVLTIVSVITFYWNSEMEYLIIPVLLWAALRFSLFETSLSIVFVSGIALVSSVQGSGPFSAKPFNEALLLMQSYLGIIAVTTLFLSSVISERIHSEEALQREKSFADTIIDSVPGAFYVLDVQGRLIRWNRFVEEINGMTADELRGMSSLRNIHDDDKKLLMNKISEGFEKGQVEAEARINTQKGLRYFLFTGRRMNIEGTPYVVGSGIDITGRKEAQQKLQEYQGRLEEMVKKRTAELTETNAMLSREIEERIRIEKARIESETKYRDLVESANSIIMRWTPEGTITFFNRFAQRFFGFEEDEIMGKNILGTIVPHFELSGRDLSTLAKNISEDPEAYILNENENTRKDGERVWVGWTNKPITGKDGQISEILSVGNDITRRKNAEESLRHTLAELAVAKERAESADRLKSAFLATMSHELRTPLNSIIGFTGIILQGLVGPLNEEQIKQLTMVRRSANHLLSLINDVLDLSKIEAGQLQVSYSPFDLRALIEQSVQTMRPAAEKKNLSITTVIARHIGTIMSDKRRVEQVILNLLSNAIKFTEQGEVRVECEKDEGFITVRVIDTGIGIKEENREKLFKPFQQIDTGITRRYEGTGLGLSICKRLVEILGGKIWVDSKWGSGSTFGFALPSERSTG